VKNKCLNLIESSLPFGLCDVVAEPPCGSIGTADGEVTVERDEHGDEDSSRVGYEIERPEYGDDSQVDLVKAVQRTGVWIDERKDVERYGHCQHQRVGDCQYL